MNEAKMVFECKRVKNEEDVKGFEVRKRLNN